MWIAWVIGGALFTRGRSWLRWFHIASLIYGVAIEIGPWPCPLTVLEQHLETKAGMTAYQQTFLVHYLDAVVYPSVPEALLTWVGVAVCVANLTIYAVRWRRVAAGPAQPYGC